MGLCVLLGATWWASYWIGFGYKKLNTGDNLHQFVGLQIRAGAFFFVRLRLTSDDFVMPRPNLATQGVDMVLEVWPDGLWLIAPAGRLRRQVWMPKADLTSSSGFHRDASLRGLRFIGDQLAESLITTEQFLLVIPMWCALLPVSALTAWFFRRDRRRFAEGSCQRCGYDLTGNVYGVCPECGTAAAGAKP
ncbi:MAG: hypothetical protein V3T70_03585 [Phycisphaerae bacterium]